MSRLSSASKLLSHLERSEEFRRFIRVSKHYHFIFSKNLLVCVLMMMYMNSHIHRSKPTHNTKRKTRYFRNKFHFSDIHRSMNAMGPMQSCMNAMGPMQSKWCPKGMLTCQKNEIHLYIYNLFFNCFCSIVVKFWCKSCKISGEEKIETNSFGYYVQQPSPWHDVTSANQPVCCHLRVFSRERVSFIAAWT